MLLPSLCASYDILSLRGVAPRRHNEAISSSVGDCFDLLTCTCSAGASVAGLAMTLTHYTKLGQNHRVLPQSYFKYYPPSFGSSAVTPSAHQYIPVLQGTSPPAKQSISICSNFWPA